MIVDAVELEDGAIVRADVCVVGAGAAGIALALELRDRGLEVVVLEGGGLELEPDAQALYASAQVGIQTDPLDVNRLRVLGGTTGHWGGWCFPLDESDFEERPWIPHSGWPFARAALDDDYATAHRILGFDAFDYDFRRWRTDEEVRDDVGLDTPTLRNFVIHRSRPPIRLGTAYRDALRDARDVRVVLHANALEIEVDGEARTATGVRASTLAGRALRVHARRYVVATGAVENARLLLASTSVQREGLGNGRDLVGRFFLQHPQVVEAHWATDPGMEAMVGRGSTSPHAIVATAVTPAAARAERMAGYHVLVLGGGSPHRKGILGPVREAVEQLRAIYDPAGGERLERDVAAFVAGVEHDARGAREGFVATLAERPEQVPNPDSRITLGEERDALGMRRVVMDWRLGELDLHTLARGRALVAKELGRLGLGRVRDWPAGYDPSARGAGYLHGGHHHFGTTRMSDDPARGVVDRNARVHGIDNLYVAGSSVFPTCGFANPTLTIVALAVRLARELRRSLGAEG